jgi:cAMP phosphodiesterase
MDIQLLPSNLNDPQHLQPLTTFLVNDSIAVDGGSLGFALGIEKQKQIRRVIITHSHADHIATLPVFIAEAYPFLLEPVYVYGSRQVITSLRRHVFNDEIWPDFHQIRLLNGSASGLNYVEVEPPITFTVEGLSFTPLWVNHTVPTTGLVVDDGRSAVAITSDTFHTDEIWRYARSLSHLRAVFVDVSYPNDMLSLAFDSKHLTPEALDVELEKLGLEVPVIAVHLKPQFRSRVIEDLRALNRPNVLIGEIGRVYHFE